MVIFNNFLIVNPKNLILIVELNYHFAYNSDKQYFFYIVLVHNATVYNHGHQINLSNDIC